MKPTFTRRQFIKSNLVAALAASSFPTIVPSSVFGAARRPSPGNRITVGCIGTGPQGRGDLGGFLGLPDAQVVAVCDVKTDQLELARRQVNDKYGNDGCATHADFRELVARKDIDAVLIASPDHWHVLHALAAVRADKDIYLEKPMGLSLAEDQLLREAVRRKKRIFQFGTQQRSSREFRRACEMVRNGRIGRLKHIYVWAPASRPGGPTAPAVAPASLNYDFWLGPARYTPYTEDKCTDTWAKTWWFNSDYALGWIAGWGVHPLDIALWGHPELFNGTMEVEGRGIYPTEGACNTAVAWDVSFSFADGVTLNFRGTPNEYKESTSLNDLSAWWKKFGPCDTGHGTLFEGTEGWVGVWRGGVRAFPTELAEEPDANYRVRLTRSQHHQVNFIQSIKSRQPAICPIDEAVQADTLCHLADLAARLGRKLRFDPRRERFVRDDEANQRLKLRPVRAPWKMS